MMTTLAHASIAHCLSMLAPFQPHPALPAAGQRQLYDWFCHLYQAMLAKPEEYLIFPQPYEDYMLKNRARLEEKRGLKQHYSDARESTLRNTVQQAISFYALFLYEAGLAALAEESTPHALYLTEEGYQAVWDKLMKMHGAEHNPARIQMLSQRGLQIIRQSQRVILTFPHMPGAMEALLFLCRAQDTPYKRMNYLRLDFINCGGTPALSHILSTLPRDFQQRIDEMQGHVLSLFPKCKMKTRPLRGITSDFQWKVEFSNKGRNIWGFYADQNSLTVCLYFGGAENITCMGRWLLENRPELLSWYQGNFPQRLCKCPYNRAVHLGDIKRRICGLSNRMDMLQPSPRDIHHAALLLDILHARIWDKN